MVLPAIAAGDECDKRVWRAIVGRNTLNKRVRLFDIVCRIDLLKIAESALSTGSYQA